MSRKKRPVKTQRPPNQSFAWFLIFVGLPVLGMGCWGVYQGYLTLTWPRADAVIQGSDLRQVQDADPQRGKTVTHAVEIGYQYTVSGRAYHGNTLEVFDFGLQNSAAAQLQHDRFPIGAKVQVAYHPANPAIACLLPGPSSTAKLLTGIGLGLIAMGLMVRRMIGLKAAGGDEVAANA